MGNYKSKNPQQKINLNTKEEFIEIILELNISDEEKNKEIYILCDKNKLIEDNKKSENYYKENNINPPKEFNYFNKDNTKLYLNDKDIKFNYKLKFNKIGINKIIINSYIKLFSLSSMFYNCSNINNIKFIKFNTKNVTDMSYMFYHCKNLSKLNLSLFNTKNVTNMSYMFDECKNLSKLNLS